MEVRFYKSSAQTEPVLDYLRSLTEADRKLCGVAIRALQTLGLDAPGLVTRQIDGKLWEIKASHQRVFYCVASGPVVWLLHAYRKAGQKAPTSEIEVAKARMKEVLR